MLSDPAARARWAKELVDASRPREELADPRDVLCEFDRSIVGHKAVALKIPLRDPQELRRHLALAEETFRALRLQLEGRRTDRSHLFMGRGVLRDLNQKINAYRMPAKD